MRGKFRVRDYIFLGLSLMDWLMREFQDPGGLVGASYKNMYGFVPDKYKKKNVSKLIRRLNQGQYITKKDAGEELYWSLTVKGKQLALKKGFLFRNKKDWDGKLRVAIFDIEESNRKKRDQLREILRVFGFAMWQKSVWVSPYPPINDFFEYLKKDGLNEFVYIFTMNPSVIDNLKAFSQRIWNINSISGLYKTWLSEVSFYQKNGEDFEKNRKNLIEKFFGIILKDPFLPEELLYSDWLGTKAKLLFIKIFSNQI